MTQVNHLPPAERRKKAVRGKIYGTAQRPRLSVYRSNKHIYAQAINDDKGETLAAANDLGLDVSGTKIEKAEQIAKVLAKRLKKADIDQVVFERGSYQYHGRVKAIAETLREEGVKV